MPSLPSIPQAELNLPICTTCATQTAYRGSDLDLKSDDTIYQCPICLDPRQFVGPTGQRWTTLSKLLRGGQHRNEIKQVDEGVWTIRTVPSFGIGQRAFLLDVEGLDGLVMWDCLAYFDEETLAFIKEKSGGRGLCHIVVSHPHYYSTTAIWAQAFPRAKLHLAKADFEDWHQRRDIWESCHGRTLSSATTAVAAQLSLIDAIETKLTDSLTVLLLGGHFPGSLVLLWKDKLFVADTIQVIVNALHDSSAPPQPGQTYVSFLWSYPNQIPLSAAEITRVCRPLESYEFDKIFGAFEGLNVYDHGKSKIMQSRDVIVQRLATT